MTNRKSDIVADIQKIAGLLGKSPGDSFAKGEYFGNSLAKFTAYELYDGGASWTEYCELAGYQTRAKPQRDDQYYFSNLQRAIDALGRLPKASERKKFALNFSKRRWATMDAFIKEAISSGVVSAPFLPSSEQAEESSKRIVPLQSFSVRSAEEVDSIVPPIPSRTRRKKWERTNVVGFPYAPQDESGVIALFAILCSNKTIPWQIVELNAGKGVDAICFDESNHKELKVELKHTLSKSNWNHSFDSLDYLVCWESKWKDFPKPVIELKVLIGE